MADTGCGISSADQKAIFAPYKQVDTNTVGTGLGLVMVKKLVELHGGTISMHSELERGASFILRLPVRASPPPSLAAPLSDSPLPGRRPRRGGSGGLAFRCDIP